MKYVLLVLIAFAMVCLAIAAFAAPDWQALTSQTARDEWTFWLASGMKADSTYGFRAYIVGAADTSLAANRFDWTYSLTCTCFAAQDTMGNGTRRRSGRYDIWRISGGTDSLVVDNAYIEGRIAAMESVDDTTMAANSVGTSEVINYSLQSADYDTNSVGALALGTESVGQDELQDGSVDSTNAAAGALSPTDLKAASAMTAGEALIATGSGGADWSTTVDVWNTTGKLTVGDGSGTDSTAFRGPVKQRDGYAFITTGSMTGATLNSTGSSYVGDRSGTDSLAVRGPLATGTSGIVGDFSMSDGSSNIYQWTPAATAVNWDMPIPIYADTVLCSTARTSMGDRMGSEYVPGILADDLVYFSMEGGTDVGATVATWGIGGQCKADSVCWGWTSGFDGKIGYYLVLRK